MKRHLIGSILSLLAVVTTSAAGPAGLTRVGEEALLHKETPHPLPLVARGQEAWLDVLTWPKASYIAVHFSKFELAPGERVVVQTPDGRWSYTFTGEGKAGMGGDFWATHVPGDTCEIHYFGGEGAPGYGYVVDRIAHGFPAPSVELADPLAEFQPEAVCGPDDANWAKCYQVSEPQIYDRSRAIARLLIAGTNICTGWLVGCQGHILTNSHCIASASDAMNTDYEFMAEGATCGTNCASLFGCPGTIVSSTGTLVATEAGRDYSLIRLPVNPTETYGYLTLRPAGPTIAERIYLPGHPGGWGKRLAVTSTDPADSGGFCRINGLSEPACVSGGPLEAGYRCDTQGGSAGSPVVAYSDHRVVAMHNCGACPNRGVPIQEIIAGLGANLPQCAIPQLAGKIELLQAVYNCSTSVDIRVYDDSLTGTGTVVVTLVSTTEPAPENVTLVETPPSSGTFLGSFPTTATAPVHGDGQLSLVSGDTIIGTYIDANDGQGGINVPRKHKAVADCTTPVISLVQATDLTEQSAVITWTTSEPADSRVTYGTVAPPANAAPIGNARVTSHSVFLEDLAPCSQHYFAVSSADTAGNLASSDNAGAYFTFSTAQSVSAQVSSLDTPLAIPDGDLTGVTSTMMVADTKTVQDVNVTLNLAHTYDSDLVVTLIAPSGTSIPLVTRRGGEDDDFTNTVFDDEAPDPISSSSPPFSGSFWPESALSAVDGINAAGPWKLHVVDTVASDTGTLLNWSLTLSYPPQPCGPHAIYRSQALVQDTCTGGGSGHHNGIADAGERIQFSVNVENDGSVPLTGVTATLTPMLPGVVMIDGTASFATIAAGATATSLTPHFTASLPTSLTCGSLLPWQLTLSTAQGSYVETFSTSVGQITPGGGTVLSESFSGGVPASWTVVNAGSGGAAAATWTTGNPGLRDFVDPIGIPAAIVDSDAAGSSATQDEQLITPVLNLSAATTVTLGFDEFFRWYANGLDEKGDVDVRSSRTSGSWVNVVRNEGVSSPPEAVESGSVHRTIDITDQAAGAADVQIRFHYYGAQYEWWWVIDNVAVTYTDSGGCAMATCTPSIGPPPVPDGSFGTPMTAERMNPSGTSIDVRWDATTCTAGGYHVLYGTLGTLPAYTVAGGSCAIGTSGLHHWTTAPAGNLWFLVVGNDTSSLEGSWGKNSSGADRKGTTPSGQCGMTARDNGGVCGP